MFFGHGGRITPAGAGKTLLSANSALVKWDHPRRCGENAAYKTPKLHASGSPPQVRGKPQASLPSSLQTRITPAGAGKTVFRVMFRHVSQDHPRRCGENYKTFRELFGRRGSPPQVRGKLRLPHRKNFVGRDHPRRCGENYRPCRTLPGKRGSPPQVRGKPNCGQRITW